jgi:hypothetical protein
VLDSRIIRAAMSLAERQPRRVVIVGSTVQSRRGGLLDFEQEVHS